ncbi:hypothetical protein ACEYW6_37215, partial [Nostoc sp. UIC 10607]|uniref:hypothetical protein n=1 Tax=Nostoc sp. UIC 10607 TaxID=3045935 RepID=UPI00399F0817
RCGEAQHRIAASHGSPGAGRVSRVELSINLRQLHSQWPLFQERLVICCGALRGRVQVTLWLG